MHFLFRWPGQEAMDQAWHPRAGVVSTAICLWCRNRCLCCFPVSVKFMNNRAMPSCFSRTADGPKGNAGERLTVGFKTCTKLRSGLYKKSAFLSELTKTP